ncbi:MAG: hypothetical protein AUG89_11570 [Acidobacteria bacterium 13_1_20CM_4_56_7]|nr:MAG: hypothetical protein AUG89_11570 [Acidobacteria bacterium 13_1_20CM_4_56_7]
MSCPTGSIIAACDFPNFFVDQTPRFDELIMEDIRPTDGWLLNVSTGTTPMGTPVEITQDRFRSVWPNTTKTWTKVNANGPGCVGNPCDPLEHQIGWGADRLTYYAEQQTWGTPLLCYDQDMHITHAEQHIAQIISDILRPATTAISSNFLRKRALLWSKSKFTANSTLTPFTFQWVLAGPNADEEIFFDCSVSPSNVFHLVPQMLQNRFSPLMRRGYAGKNPFKDTSPFIELVTDMDTCWFLDKLGGQLGNGGGDLPNTASNWRFTEWGAANAYWRYGFSGQIGNFMVRVDEMGLRFNFVQDLGAGAHGGNGNRFRYQIVLPYVNGVTTGAGSAAGLGSDENPDFDRAQFTISFIWHKKALELLVPDARPLNPEMPFGHRDFGGKWRFAMHDLGADSTGSVITNKWENKGQFISWFKYYVRPLHYEFAEAFFHKREQFCIPNIDVCSPSPGYPAQQYSSTLPACPIPGSFGALYGTGVPTGDQDGPILSDRVAPGTPDQ